MAGAEIGASSGLRACYAHMSASPIAVVRSGAHSVALVRADLPVREVLRDAALLLDPGELRLLEAWLRDGG